MSTSSLPEPQDYGVQVYALGQSGPLGSDLWQPWDTSAPFTISLYSGLAVKAIWFPYPQGEMSFYAGDTATGTPFYVTPGVVAEMVAIPNDAPVVTVAFSGMGSPIVYFYASSVPFTPFAAGTPPEITVGVIEPIVNAGTSEEPIIGLDTPLAVIYGGSGSTAPSLIAGANVTIVGSWPNQEINVAEGAGGVQSVGVQAPIILVPGGSDQNPVIGLLPQLPLGDGGTGIANPWIKGGTGIDINGVSGANDNTFQWIVNNDGVIKVNPGNITGVVTVTSADGSVDVTNPSGNDIDLSVNFPNSKAFYGKQQASTSSGPNTISMNLGPLPAGTWLIEASASGIEAPETSGSDGATLSLSSGPSCGWTQNQYTRALYACDSITSSGSSTPTATLQYSSGCGVNANSSAIFFSFKATRVA